VCVCVLASASTGAVSGTDVASARRRARRRHCCTPGWPTWGSLCRRSTTITQTLEQLSFSRTVTMALQTETSATTSILNFLKEKRVKEAKTKGVVSIKKVYIFTFAFTFRAFGRRFYPKRLTKSTFVEGDSDISLWYIKIRIEQVSSIHSCEANRTSFIIVRLSA